MSTETTDLKAKLMPLRELVLGLNHVLTWEEPFYPAVIAGTTTLGFLVLYFMDMSNLTLFPLLLALGLILDTALPLVTPKLFDTTKWTPTQEQEFEKVCETLSKFETEFRGICKAVVDAKEKSTRLFLVVAVVFLLCLAWLGTILNELFVAYIICLTVAMLPGLKKKGALDKVIQLVLSKTKMQ